MTEKVLFVDDEKNILSALRRLFYKEGYELLFANSGAEGLRILKDSPVSVIVSDMRMPEMDGVEFLKNARGICPDAVRMVLSGYSEINSIMEAVNQGHIWRFVTKPWDDTEIKLTIKNAMENYNLTMERKQLLSELEVKNQQLAQMNANLEEKIRERTWQLQERSELLNFLAEGSDYNKILEKSCAAISRQLDGLPVFVYAPHLKRSFSNNGDALSTSGQQLAQRAISVASPQADATAQAIFVNKQNTPLGALVINSLDKQLLQRHKDGIQCFTSIIALALAQQKSLEEAPDFINDIDRIIDNLEE